MHPTTTHRHASARNPRRGRPAVRRSAGAVLAAGVLLLSACGDDAIEPAGQSGDDTVAPTATDGTTDDATGDSTGEATGDGTDGSVPGTTVDDGTGDGVEHPNGADEVVVQIEQVGGFVPMESVFASLPDLVVTGDGSRYSPGAQIAIYPGPLLPAVEVADVGEQGIQDVLALAVELDLLRPLDLEGGEMVADATTTVVTIRAAGETFEHSAYALGIGGLDGAEESDDRAALEEFVERANQVTSAEDATLLSADQYYLAAFPVDDLSGYAEEPTLVDWPADAPVELATAGECAEVAGRFVESTLADADELTFFTEDGETYRVAVKPVFPGVGC